MAVHTHGIPHPAHVCPDACAGLWSPPRLAQALTSVPGPAAGARCRCVPERGAVLEAPALAQGTQ